MDRSPVLNLSRCGWAHVLGPGAPETGRHRVYTHVRVTFVCSNAGSPAGVFMKISSDSQGEVCISGNTPSLILQLIMPRMYKDLGVSTLPASQTAPPAAHLFRASSNWLSQTPNLAWGPANGLVEEYVQTQDICAVPENWRFGEVVVTRVGMRNSLHLRHLTLHPRTGHHISSLGEFWILVLVP